MIMMFLIFFILIPNSLYTSTNDSKNSPKRFTIHSKSTSEIPSLTEPMSAVSQALNIPQRPGRHARKRSNSEKEIQMPDEWASPPSSSTWVAPLLTRSPSQHRTLDAGSKKKSKRSCKELNEADEKIWREKRSLLPRLQRSASVPSEMNFHHTLLASSVKDAASARLLARVAYSQEQNQKSIVETLNDLKRDRARFENLFGRLAYLSIQLEGLFSQHATLISAFEGTVEDMHALTRRIEALEKHPSSAAEQIDAKHNTSRSRSNSDKDKRPRSSGSFLNFGFGHKE